MQLRPQDVVVILKILAGEKSSPWSYAGLGEQLGMSASNVFNSIARSETAHLLSASQTPRSRGNKGRGILAELKTGNLKEFLIHGVKYAFPAERGGSTRGMPTAEAASPLREFFPEPSLLQPVWPDHEGSVRGTAFSPLYKNAPYAAKRDAKLYELLALTDAIREGRSREREIAIRELTARIDEAQVKSA